MSSNNSTAICALVFLFILVICVVIALWYNPAPVEVIKCPVNKSTSDLLAERVKARNSPVKSNMTPQNRAANTPTFSDGSSNNDPWAALDRVDNERVIKHRPPM